MKPLLRSWLFNNSKSLSLKAFCLLAKGFIALLLFPLNVSSQVNYVVNGGFEKLDSCSIYAAVNNPSNALSWDTLRAGGGGGPDLMNSCINDPQLGVPYNASCSYQIPHGGNGYCEFYVFSNNSSSFAQREYLQNKLRDTLIANKTYCVTFYISLLNCYGTAIDRFGAYLDDGSIKAIAPYKVAYANPQILSADTNGIGESAFLSDTLNWMKIQGSFVATGTESYISIGNFNDYANTHHKQFNFSTGILSSAYYIDDVSMIEINTKAEAGRDTTINEGDSTYVGLHDIGDDYTWYANGLAFYNGSEAGLFVKPTITTTYVCKQQVCSVVTYDTVKVTVIPKVLGIKSNPLLKTEIYPNPSSGTFNIDIPNTTVNISVYNTLGMLVKAVNLVKGRVALNLSNEPMGLYFVKITDPVSNESITRKVIVQR